MATNIYLTECDTDVTYPGGITWASRTVRVDQKDNRPLGHWKRGLDVDTWQLILEPRNFDAFSGTLYPDKVNGTPWIAAARSGAFDGWEVEILRAFFPKWPPYKPVITPTGILSVFAGRIAEVDVTDSNVVITLNDMRELMTTMVPKDVFQAQCRHTLFDFGCLLNVAGFINFATADTGSTQSTVIAVDNLDTFLAAMGAGITYTLGKILFVSGLNAGISRTIRIYSGPFTLQMLNPLPFAVTAGDNFQIFPGCNKTMAACTAYNNIVHFGGFPYIPTVNAAV